MANDADGGTPRLLAVVSAVVSVVLAIALGLVWLDRANASIESSQVTHAAAVDAVLDLEARGYPDALTIPTGVFVQSLSFQTATDVHMSGYIWQRWPDDAPAGVSEGFALPDLVESAIPAQEEYRVPQDGHELIGWYFEGVFRQPFEYDDYPFDHKKVWLRIWPRDFGAAVVLTPDFDAYPATGVDDVFGIETNIVLGNWTREDTYFDYLEPVYNTDFGIEGFDGAGEIPELRFNVVLRRNFANPFVVNVVPLAVVAALAFGTALTVTRSQSKASVLGYSVSGVLATVSALFFVVLLAHIQLRTELPGTGLVYFEYLYFVMYLVLLLVAVNARQVSVGDAGIGDADGENRAMVLLFWPVLIGGVLLVTLLAV